ncbi:hypothetical protein [Pollutibacter soli]|uniref:hypothetical protein n=1 Tax=Pollutibacter soli TaxID=3034157 RepID=UPI0030140256
MNKQRVLDPAPCLKEFGKIKRASNQKIISDEQAKQMYIYRYYSCVIDFVDLWMYMLLPAAVDPSKIPRIVVQKTTRTFTDIDA